MTNNKKAMRKLHKWLPEEEQVLKERYPHEGAEYIAPDLGVSIRAIENKAFRLGLSKTKEYWSNNRGRFQLGNRHGAAPKKRAPIGNSRLGKGYYPIVKITDTGNTDRDYVLIHHLVWELHHGPIPPECTVVFKDGNCNNSDPDNLELISRAELMKRNSISRFPEELQEIIRMKGQLTKAIAKRKKS